MQRALKVASTKKILGIREKRRERGGEGRGDRKRKREGPIENNRKAWRDRTLASSTSVMRITMLLFPPSYRVGHHRHRFCLPRRIRVPFMSLSYTLRLVSTSSQQRRRRCNVPILRTENFNGPTRLQFPLNRISFTNNNENRARACTFHVAIVACRWMTITYYSAYQRRVYVCPKRGCFNHRSRSLPSR